MPTSYIQLCEDPANVNAFSTLLICERWISYPLSVDSFVSANRRQIMENTLLVCQPGHCPQRWWMFKFFCVSTIFLHVWLYLWAIHVVMEQPRVVSAGSIQLTKSGTLQRGAVNSGQDGYARDMAEMGTSTHSTFFRTLPRPQSSCGKVGGWEMEAPGVSWLYLIKWVSIDQRLFCLTLLQPIGAVFGYTFFP